MDTVLGRAARLPKDERDLHAPLIRELLLSEYNIVKRDTLQDVTFYLCDNIIPNKVEAKMYENLANVKRIAEELGCKDDFNQHMSAVLKAFEKYKSMYAEHNLLSLEDLK